MTPLVFIIHEYSIELHIAVALFEYLCVQCGWNKLWLIIWRCLFMTLLVPIKHIYALNTVHVIPLTSFVILYHHFVCIGETECLLINSDEYRRSDSHPLDTLLPRDPHWIAPKPSPTTHGTSCCISAVATVNPATVNDTTAYSILLCR